MAADHRSMVRFSSSKSEKFEPVWYALQELIRGAPTEAPHDGSHHKYDTSALSYAMEAFHVTDYFEQLSSITTPAPGTCEWVPSHVSFQDWLGSSESDMLWLRGYPGVGKTVLTKHLIESVIPSRRALRNADGKSMGEEPTGDDILVYFFCNDSNVERKVEENILKAFLHQFLTLTPALVTAFESRMGHRKTKWQFAKTTAGLWGILEDIILVAKAKTIYVVLDALDEMDGRRLEGFTAALARLVDYVRPRIAPRQLKVLLTSRPEPEIEQNLHCASIAIRSERDVMHYVTNLVQPFAAYHGFPPDSTEKVIDNLTTKAGNMFLWARLAWAKFKEGIVLWSPKRVEERLQALELLPPGLEALYENILSRYKDHELELLMNVFSLLIASTRPLNTKELGVALGIKELTTSIKEIDVAFCMATQLKIISPNLLAVDATGHVEFTHQSFKDFLLSPETIPRYQIDIAEAHAKIAISCLRCFTLDNLNAGKVRDSISDKGMRSDTLVHCELLLYASKQWQYHAKSASKDKRIWEAYQRLYQRRDSFGLWWVMFQYDNRFSRAHKRCYADTPLPTPFQVAVALNIPYLVEVFVSSGTEINQQDWFFGARGGTVLHFECVESKMIRYLIAHGADVRIQNKRGDTPLHDALIQNNLERFLMLLECMPADVDLNVANSLGRTVLHSAIEMDFLPAVAKLIDDSRVELLFNDNMTSLEIACAWGKEGLLRILLASSRVVEAQREKRSKDSAKMSLVFTAVLQGWEELALDIMRRLPTDIENEKDKDGRTILHHAVMENWHLLLDQCLDQPHRPKLNEMDKNGMTALHWAAKVRNRYAAIRLLDSGAQAGTRNDEGKTPLHVAAEAGSEQVLAILLDRTDNLLPEIDKQRRTVLHYAATWDLEPLIRGLVNSSYAEIDAKDCHGRTPAHLAALFGCPGVLNFLLNLVGEAGINASDYYGNSILHCAVEGGSEACIQNLIDRSALRMNLLNRYDKSVIDITYCDSNKDRAKRIRAMLRERGARFEGYWDGAPTPFPSSTSQLFGEEELERSRIHEQNWQVVPWDEEAARRHNEEWDYRRARRRSTREREDDSRYRRRR